MEIKPKLTLKKRLNQCLQLILLHPKKPQVNNSIPKVTVDNVALAKKYVDENHK